MIGYAAEELFSLEEKRLLGLAQAMVLQAPYEIDGECVRCHELARAVALLLEIPRQVSDGWYGQVDHTWIWTTPREAFSPLPNVLDVYTPGRHPQVILIHTSTHLPFEYRRGARRRDIRKKVISDLVTLMRHAVVP